MAGVNPEVQDQYETVEQKKKRLDFDLPKDDNQKDEGQKSPLESAFNDLSSELGKPKNGGEKYTTEDIQDAASKRLDKMVSASGIQLSKLNPDEKQKLENIKMELLKNMNGKSPKEAIEEFGKVREKVEGIIAAGDGKSQKTAQDFQQSQERGKEINQKTQDAFDKFQDFLDEVRYNQNKQKDKIKQQGKIAQAKGNATSGNNNPPYGNEVMDQANKNFAFV